VKASLNMKPIIADDMRGFVGEQLKSFASSRELTDEDTSLLVELVTAALRHNPRRVKEFVANLELQLRFIEGREKSGAIVGEPSKDVLMGAKLLLLEEEWSDLYDALRHDYEALAKWHSDIPAGRMAELPDEPRFLAFMNTSRSVSDENLRVFLRLKQSRAELQLPEYEVFREALIGGLRDEVATLMESSSSGADAFAVASGSILGEELDRKFLAGARNVIEVLTSSESLISSDVAARSIMARVANHPELRVELSNSAPAPILRAADRLLDDTLFDQLAETFVGFIELISGEQDRLTDLLSALIPVLPRLSPKRRGELAAALIGVPEETPLSVFGDIAVADAALVPDAVGNRALEECEPEFDASSDAFLILSAMLRREPSVSGLDDAFLSAVNSHVTHALADPSAVGSDETGRLGRLAEELRVLEGGSEGAADQLTVTINSNFSASMQQDWQDALLELMAPACELASVDNAQSSASSVLTHYRDTDRPGFLSFLRTRADSLTGRFGLIAAQVLHALLDNVSAPQEDRMAAASLIAQVNPPDDQTLLGDAVRRMIERGELDLARTLREDYPDAVRLSEQEIVTATLNRAESEVPELSPATLGFLEVIFPELDDTQLSRIESILANQVEDGDDDDAEAAFAAAEQLLNVRVDFGERTANIVRGGFDSVASTDDPTATFIGSLATRAGFLDPDRRESLIAQMARWISMPSVEQGAIGRAATRFPELSAGERLQLVVALIDAETAAVGNLDLRESLLRAALALMGRRNSRAASRVDARMATIRGEHTDENADLLNRLTAAVEEAENEPGA
jgi:hypothetical protein